MQWFCIFLLAVSAALPMSAQRRPVIIDTNIGDDVDDALALGFALQSPELDVKAVTTVIDDVRNRTRLAAKEVGVFARPSIPVGTGAAESLLDPMRVQRSAEFNVLTGPEKPGSINAIELIRQTIANSRDKVTIIALGPLTNIALVLKTFPETKEKIERIVIMGGSYQTAQAEYNLQRDRIAAEIVFRSGVPIIAVGSEFSAQCELRAQDRDRLRVAESPAAHFVIRLMELARGETHREFPELVKALAVAAAYRPDLIETEPGRVDISINDPATYGVSRFTAEESGTTNVVRKVKAAEFLNLFAQRISGGVPGIPTLP